MPMLTNPVTDMNRPKMNRGDLTGIVIDNNDPNKRQRVKLRIPQLHRNISDEDLPWAIQDSHQGTANAGQGVGSVNVPPIGAKLFVRIDDNDPHNPRYGSSPPTDDVNKDNELLKEDYPHTRGQPDHAGNVWSINAEKQTITVTHKSGTTFHIDANGTVSVSCLDFNVGAEGNINMTAKKKINLSADGDMNLNGKKINLNGGGGGTSTARTERSRPQIPSPAGNTTA